MKAYHCIITAVFLGLSVTGCMSPQGQPDYTASGALAGAATGAIIGSAARHSGTGSLVGAAVGAVAGGAVGHGIDQARESQREQLVVTQGQTLQSPPLSLADIKAQAGAGIGDDLIISQIRNSRMVYHLNTADIISLKRSGVSEGIIDYMIDTPATVQYNGAGVAVGAPPAPIGEQVLIAPGPDYYWMNGTWIWFDGNWVWRHGYWRGPVAHYRHGRRWR